MGMCSLSPDDMNGMHWFRIVVNGQCEGDGILPVNLGLESSEFIGFCHDSALRFDDYQAITSESQKAKSQQLLAEIQARKQEYKRLETWLNTYECSEDWPIAKILALACMGSNKIWVDLGLDNSEQFTLFMEECFPELILKNHLLTNWKAFFFLQSQE